MVHGSRAAAAFPTQGIRSAAQIGADHRRQPLQQVSVQRSADGPLMQLPLPRLADAIGREHTRQRMQQHLMQSQGFRQSTGQLTCGTAVGDQDAPADVMPAKQRHLTNGRSHGFDRQIERTFRQLFRGLPQLRGKPVKARTGGLQVRALIPGGTEHGRKCPCLQPAKQQVGISDGERTAPAITDRAWIGSGGARPHQQSSCIRLDDRATPCRDGVNRQARGRQQQPGDLGLGTAFPVEISRTGRQAEHIRAGAAHINPHQRLRRKARLLGGSHRADHAAGGPRQDRVLGQHGSGRLQRPA